MKTTIAIVFAVLIGVVSFQVFGPTEQDYREMTSSALDRMVEEMEEAQDWAEAKSEELNPEPSAWEKFTGLFKKDEEPVEEPSFWDRFKRAQKNV
jgi:hypothetical protein